MCTQKRQMKMKETDEPNLIVTNLGHLNLVLIRICVRVCVQTKVRTIVRARERKDEDEET